MAQQTNQYDANVVNKNVNSFNTDNGLTSSGNYSNQNIQNQSVVDVYGKDDINLQLYAASFTQNLLKFEQETGVFLVTSDLANNNNYIAETLKSEGDRISNLKNKTVNTVYKTQQKFFQKKYVIEYNRFIANVFKYLIMLAIILSVITSYFLKGSISTFIFTFVVLTLIVFTFLVIALYFKNLHTRRRDDWNKYYFQSMDLQVDNVCTNPAKPTEVVINSVTK
jgi:hypothetical protein